MKYIILLCFSTFLTTLCISQPSLKKVRNLYVKAATDENACNKLIKMLKQEENNPLYLGYKGSAIMMMANHTFNPFQKLSYFKKGKSMLNRAIKKATRNAELRFLRLTAQLRAPAFLSYDDQIESDKKHLVYLLKKTDNTSLKQYIIPKIRQLHILE